VSALRQSIEAEGKPAAPVPKESPSTKPAAPKSKKTAKRNPDQRDVAANSRRRSTTAKGAGAKKTSASK